MVHQFSGYLSNSAFQYQESSKYLCQYSVLVGLKWKSLRFSHNPMVAAPRRRAGNVVAKWRSLSVLVFNGPNLFLHEGGAERDHGGDRRCEIVSYSS